MKEVRSEPSRSKVRSSGRRRYGLAGAAAVVLVALGAFLLTRGAPKAAAPESPTVTAAMPLLQTVSLWDDYVGRFAATQSVEVRPRVAGAVVGIHFEDGQTVQRGQLLYTIDPRPFAAALAEARGSLATANSALSLAASDLTRADALQGDEALAAAEMDGLRAKVQGAQAAVASGAARVQAKALDVEFTQVRAPIAGRVSDHRVDIGNLVTAGDGASSSLLTTINALDPIYFEFDSPESLYRTAAQGRGQTATPVEIRLQGDAAYRWKGRLDFTDNGLDARSGTIRGRAILANPTLMLMPGQFGNMRMSRPAPTQAMLIPDVVVQSDQAKKSVLALTPDNVVVVKEVVLGPAVDGLRVVVAGLKPTDRIIIGGALAAAPGSTVKVVKGAFAAHAHEPTVPAPPPAAQATLAAN